jgi:hypothetical protein
MRSSLFFGFCPLLLCWVGVYWHLQRFLQCIKYHAWIQEWYLSPLPPVPGTVSTGIIFAFACMCTHFLHLIHPPTPFPHHLPTPTGAKWTCRSEKKSKFNITWTVKKTRFHGEIKHTSRKYSLMHYIEYIIGEVVLKTFNKEGLRHMKEEE